MVVTFLVKHTLPLPHPETSRFYLNPPPLAAPLPLSKGRHLWTAPSCEIQIILIEMV